MNPYPTCTSVVESWENLWHTLHDDGWHLSHFAYQDSDSGSLRHLVRAKKTGDELICTAPSFVQALTLIFVESRDDTSVFH